MMAIESEVSCSEGFGILWKAFQRSIVPWVGFQCDGGSWARRAAAGVQVRIVMPRGSLIVVEALLFTASSCCVLWLRRVVLCIELMR